MAEGEGQNVIVQVGQRLQRRRHQQQGVVCRKVRELSPGGGT